MSYNIESLCLLDKAGPQLIRAFAQLLEETNIKKKKTLITSACTYFSVVVQEQRDNLEALDSNVFRW